MALVTALPTPPSRANPSTFSADTDTFLAALSQFATEVNAVGQAVVVGPMAVAGGTADAITANFTPDIALTNGQTVLVRAGYSNATTTPTFNPDGLGARTIVRGANQALVAGDIAGAGHWLQLQYDSTLGRWVLQNPATALVAASCSGNAATATNVTYAPAVRGAYKKLALSANGQDAYVNVAADEIILENASNVYQVVRDVSLTLDVTASGANGIDTGSRVATTWYSVWVIYNPTTQTTAGLFSRSTSSPTLPAGYTFSARVGWVLSDGTAAMYPYAFTQRGRAVRWRVLAGSNRTALPILRSGVAGSITEPAWVSVPLDAYVMPPTISKIVVAANGLSTGGFMLASGSGFGAYNSTTNPPPYAQYATVGVMTAELLLSSANPAIYWANSNASTSLFCVGWEDDI